MQFVRGRDKFWNFVISTSNIERFIVVFSEISKTNKMTYVEIITYILPWNKYSTDKILERKQNYFGIYIVAVLYL